MSLIRGAERSAVSVSPGKPIPPGPGSNFPAGAPEDREATTGFRAVAVLIVLSLTGVIVSLQQTVIIPLLPDLPRQLDTTVNNASWLVTSTLIAGAVATPTFARLADMFGKKLIMLSVLALSVLGSLTAAVGASLEVLIAARSLQGVGMALVPIGIAFMRDELPADRVPLGVATMSATLAIGAGGGLPLAGLIAEKFEWQATFWFSAVGGLVMMIALAVIIRESGVRTPGRFDFLGTLLLSGGLTTLLLALSKGADWGWASSYTIGCAVTAVVLLTACIPLELKVPNPLVDLRVAFRPAVLFVNLCALLAGFGMYINMLVNAQIMQAPTETGYGLGMGFAEVGLWMAPSAVAFGAAAPVAALLMRRFNPLTVLVVGTLIMGLTYIVRIFFSNDLLQVIIGSVLVGFGTSLAYAAMPILIMKAVPAGEGASAVGLNSLMRVIGTSASSATVAAVATVGVVRVSGVLYPDFSSIVIVFSLAASLCLLAGLVVLPLRRGRTPRNRA